MPVSRIAHYAVGTVSGPVQNLEVGSVPFTEDCDDDLSLQSLDKPIQMGHFSILAMEYVPSFLANHKLHSLGEVLIAPRMPRGLIYNDAYDELMEYFKLGGVELNGSFDDDSLDLFEDTYFIAFIAEDA
ncbi:hypothetical protein N7530_010701 [Penicillium desertorum]|uniref:Uncharacterized protein n=1 Tax=Penicillium desertorum TaxID=1303715 RepID=A0A9W9WI27_9EURO|nr:hypothetical protein N7530_010701 [Penicillium desertorum]